MLRVRSGREKVLYVEGEPRSEFAFIRRAVADDSALQVAGLLRSAKGKFLRLGVDDSLDLIGGFPTRRDELFKYRAIILGNVEAAFFTGDQLRMIADFVDRRGGALIALGGRSALGEGGYAGTPIADALPITFEAPRRAADTQVVVLKVEPTAPGSVHPALQLGATSVVNTARWDSLPTVTAVNHLGDLRPGASLLLSGHPTPRGPDQPVLAVQRYGRGVAALLGVQDTWLWKMDPKSPVEDRSYETFWRQLIRWGLDQVPDRVEITAVPARVGPGEAVTLRARVVDSIYMDVNDAAVTAKVTTPSGNVVEVPLEWTLKDDGTYAGHFTADESGMYQVVAEAKHGTETTSSAKRVPIRAEPDMDRAELRTSLLQRIAAETGGHYYPLNGLAHLPDDVLLTESGITAP